MALHFLLPELCIYQDVALKIELGEKEAEMLHFGVWFKNLKKSLNKNIISVFAKTVLKPEIKKE